MSATLDKEKLMDHFKAFSPGLLSIDGIPFDREIRYLDQPSGDFLESAIQIVDNLIFKESQPWLCFKCSNASESSVFVCNNCKAIRSPHILVFLPGHAEIKAVSAACQEGPFKLLILQVSRKRSQDIRVQELLNSRRIPF
jgi:HrpA-like RNA helicase